MGRSACHSEIFYEYDKYLKKSIEDAVREYYLNKTFAAALLAQYARTRIVLPKAVPAPSMEHNNKLNRALGIEHLGVRCCTTVFTAAQLCTVLVLRSLVGSRSLFCSIVYALYEHPCLHRAQKTVIVARGVARKRSNGELCHPAAYYTHSRSTQGAVHIYTS